MASKAKMQRIGIWIITIAVTLGTIGSFVVIVLANSNSVTDTTAQQKSYNDQIAAQQKAAIEAAQTNADNSEGFDGYTTQKFDATSATSLKVETLVQGSGDIVKSTDSINASYFGWTSDGKIFDSSKKKASADSPSTFPLSRVIKGWTQGLTGIKVGSVVRLTIPSDLAYGPTGSGVIPANAPLQFIVKIIKIDNSAAGSSTGTAQ
jgi:FKBP-type peptidyl-prolyl cis-trans isomerase FkpA